VLGLAAAAGEGDGHQTCGDLKTIYKDNECCGNPDKLLNMQVVPRPMGKFMSLEANPCEGTKPTDASFDNVQCIVDAINEQSGADVSDGVTGDKETDAVPILSSYMNAGLCPVNVHWHLGAEHLSTGHYDSDGSAPDNGRRLESELPASYHRRLASDVRYGGKCHYYDADDAKFTTEYDWKHCVGMHVGHTYEVHWPHSRVGACGTPNQYQSPFYDGVFCHFGAATSNPAIGVEYVAGGSKGSGAPAGANLSGHVGVQAQVFTIVNDEDYFYPDLMRGMILDGEYGKHMAYYTGSTTGTSRDNAICSQYAPITWQVDRRCHLISASTFDKMCADMKLQADDMSMDLHAHGAREVVLPEYAANNQEQQSHDRSDPFGR
jgi:hypothetical protein